MSQLEHLRDQEARASRLAGAITDVTTIERFLEFAARCREQVAAMSPVTPALQPDIGAL
jgi:hypothetical protein